MKGSPRRDALTAKFLLPPYALMCGASTVGPKPGSGQFAGEDRALFTGCGGTSRPERGCLEGEGEPHKISGAFPPREEPASLSLFAAMFGTR